MATTLIDEFGEHRTDSEYSLVGTHADATDELLRILLVDRADQRSRRLEKRKRLRAYSHTAFKATRLAAELLHTLVEIALLIVAAWAIERLIAQDVSNVRQQVRDVRHSVEDMQSQFCQFTNDYEYVLNLSTRVQEIYNNISAELPGLKAELDALTKFKNETISAWSGHTYMVSVGWGATNGYWYNQSMTAINTDDANTPMCNKTCSVLYGYDYSRRYWPDLYYCTDRTIVGNRSLDNSTCTTFVRFSRGEEGLVGSAFQFTRTSSRSSENLQQVAGMRIPAIPAYSK